MNIEGGKVDHLPQKILEKVIRLHRHFYGFLDISQPDAKATGMIYFDKFYQLKKKDPPRYALYAIASLHLASKICEEARSLRRFSQIVYETLFTEENFGLLDGLDGIPNPSVDEDEDITNLIKLLIQAEMEIIGCFKFKFTVNLPYQYADKYISEIIHWHLPNDHPQFTNLQKELKSISWNFLNDLQMTHYFYTSPPEIVALAAVFLTFDRVRLPLDDPANQKWYHALAPGFDEQAITSLFNETLNFFVQKLLAVNQKLFQPLRTKINILEFSAWTACQFDPMVESPTIPPPPLELIGEYAGGDDFTKMDADHAPPVPPPSDETEPTPELRRMMREMERLRLCEIERQRERDRDRHNENKHREKPRKFHKNDKNDRNDKYRNEKNDKRFERDNGIRNREEDSRNFGPGRRVDRDTMNRDMMNRVMNRERDYRPAERNRTMERAMMERERDGRQMPNFNHEQMLPTELIRMLPPDRRFGHDDRYVREGEIRERDKEMRGRGLRERNIREREMRDMDMREREMRERQRVIREDRDRQPERNRVRPDRVMERAEPTGVERIDQMIPRGPKPSISMPPRDEKRPKQPEKPRAPVDFGNIKSGWEFDNRSQPAPPPLSQLRPVRAYEDFDGRQRKNQYEVSDRRTDGRRRKGNERRDLVAKRMDR